MTSVQSVPMSVCASCGYRNPAEALETVERTDGLDWLGDAFCDLTEVLAAVGRSEGAAETLEHALDRCRRKKTLA